MRSLLLLAVIGVFGTCPLHRCGELEAGYCLQRQGLDYVYELCPESTPYCNLNYEKDVGKCSANLPDFRFTGEYCKADFDCFSKNCTDKVCIGPSDHRCRTTLDCLPGERCSENRCRQLIPAGQSGCYVNTDCEIHSGCFEGLCIPFFSLFQGAKTVCTVYMTSLLCESGRCADLHCIAKPDSSTSYPAECYDDYECEVEECVGYAIPAVCSCGLTSKPHGSCRLRVTDDAMQEYLDLVKEWLLGPEVEHCHSSARFAQPCMRIYWSERKIKRLQTLSLLFKSAPLQDLQPCVLDVLLHSSHLKHIII
jgi:hypothetical protein